MNEQKDDRWMAGAAVGFSIAVHVGLLLLLGFLMATSQVADEEVENPEEDNTVMITADLFEPSFIRTAADQESDTQPEEKPFISDRNTLAATELESQPKDDRPVPTQEGEDRNFTETTDRELAEGERPDDRPEGSEPSPQVPMTTPPSPPTPPQQTPPEGEEVPEDTKTEDLPPEEDLLNKVKGMEEVPLLPPQDIRIPLAPPPTPPTPVQPAAKPGDDVFKPQTRKNQMHGTISNRGRDSVNAVRTPRGEYMKAVTTAIERKWHVYRRQHLDFATFGNLRLRFEIRPDGSVKGLTVVSQDANAVMADFTLRAIRDAEIPAMPKGIEADLDGEPLQFNYDVLIY